MRWERVKLSESCSLTRKRGITAGAREGKMDSTVQKGRFQGGEGGYEQGGRPAEIRLKCQSEPKAFEKSIVARIV